MDLVQNTDKVESSSAEYKGFLDFLGEKITLKGWKGYKAGLDVAECKFI